MSPATPSILVVDDEPDNRNNLADILTDLGYQVAGRAGHPSPSIKFLTWADRLHQKTGRWPTVDDGKVVGAGGENWRGINLALDRGYRGLPGSWPRSWGIRPVNPVASAATGAWVSRSACSVAARSTAYSGPIRARASAPHAGSLPLAS